VREPDIGSDATLAGRDDVPPASRGSDVPTMSPHSPRTSSTHAASSLLRTLTVAPADLPTDLDRSSLSPAERALTVSRYILLSRLGAGGMGLVFLAYDPALGRKVALKLLRPGDDREPAAEAHARLHREAQALARLSHPNVVAVYDVGTYDAHALYGADHGGPGDGVFIVMEYIEGVTLARWLDERPRPWREVLAVFLAAGRGLAAAHAVGILHRDFKPSNVLLKQDGSVHVFDFGLARAAHHRANDLEAAVPTPSTSSALTTTSVSLAAPLTQYGAVLGTPVYMAPEQRGGEDVDERCDQFSFCVALYEGLFGTRPFSGENFYALEVAKLAGAIDPPKRPVTVPKRLRRAVVRGLAGEPGKRWPNLAALLLELERVHNPRRGRRFAVAGLLLGLTVGVSAVAATREPLCTGAAAAFGDAWDPRHAPMLERTFAGTGLPYARDTWQRTRERLDRHAVAWLAMHRDACAATNIDRTQSPERMDRRMRCLDHARDELAALVVVFASADAEVVANAVAAVTALTPISACEDPGAAPPEPPEAAQITLASAEQHAGHHQASRALAEASLAAAEARGDRATMSAAADILGDALSDLSELAAAERAFTRAYFDAVAAGRDALALGAATELVSLLGDRLARPADGHAWARHAEALLDRLGRPPAGEAAYLHNLANLHARSGEYGEAEPLYRRALAILPADAPFQRGVMLTNLASTIAYLGNTQESIDLYNDALEIREATLGADHPLVAQTLFNLGGSYALLGDNDRNEAVQRRALAIWRASLTPRHELLAYPLAALGDIALQRADYDEAFARFEEARAIWEHNFGPAYPTVASMHERMATTKLMQGDVAEARVLCDRSVELWTRSGASEPLQLAMALMLRSQIAQVDGDLAAARSYGERARVTTAKDFGDDNLYTLAARLQIVIVDLDAAERRHAGPSDPALPAAIAELDAILATMEREHGRDARWLVEPLVVEARAYRLAGRSADARTVLARATPIADANKLVAGRADIDLALALATWELDPPRARSLATSALAVYRTLGARRSADEAEQWLREHPLP
jgi:tetratricopeptide (TPR) repeat protein